MEELLAKTKLPYVLWKSITCMFYHCISHKRYMLCRGSSFMFCLRIYYRHENTKTRNSLGSPSSESDLYTMTHLICLPRACRLALGLLSNNHVPKMRHYHSCWQLQNSMATSCILVTNCTKILNKTTKLVQRHVLSTDGREAHLCHFNKSI